MLRIQQLLIHLFGRKFGQTPAKYGLEENVDRNMVLWLEEQLSELEILHSLQ